MVRLCFEKRWIDGIESDMRIAGVIEQDVGDRALWSLPYGFMGLKGQKVVNMKKKNNFKNQMII